MRGLPSQRPRASPSWSALVGSPGSVLGPGGLPKGPTPPIHSVSPPPRPHAQPAGRTRGVGQAHLEGRRPPQALGPRRGARPRCRAVPGASERVPEPKVKLARGGWPALPEVAQAAHPVGPLCPPRVGPARGHVAAHGLHLQPATPLVASILQHGPWRRARQTFLWGRCANGEQAPESCSHR